MDDPLDVFTSALKSALPAEKQSIVTPALVSILFDACKVQAKTARLPIDEELDRIREERRASRVFSRLAVESADDLESAKKDWSQALRQALSEGTLSRGGGRTLADLFDGWLELEGAISAVRGLKRAADHWDALVRLNLHRTAKGGNFGRRYGLASWVAVHLQAAGARPTKAPNGIFASVLEVVYRQAGIDIKDVYRDVRTTLNRESTKRLLADESVIRAVQDRLQVQTDPRKIH